MPQPTAGDVHVNRLLGNVSTAYIQKQSAFIAAEAFPVVPVDNKSDRYPAYSKEDWMRDEAQERAPGPTPTGLHPGARAARRAMCTWEAAGRWMLRLLGRGPGRGRRRGWITVEQKIDDRAWPGSRSWDLRGALQMGSGSSGVV